MVGVPPPPVQFELRRYLQKDSPARERGTYWYFRYHEGGRQEKLYLGTTKDREGEAACKRFAKYEESRNRPVPCRAMSPRGLHTRQ